MSNFYTLKKYVEIFIQKNCKPYYTIDDYVKLNHANKLSLIEYIRLKAIDYCPQLEGLDINFVSNFFKDAINLTNKIHIHTEKNNSFFNFLIAFVMNYPDHPKEIDTLVKYFVNSGFDPNIKNGNTPLLHFVAAYGSCETVKWLVEKDVDLSLIDSDDSSLLSSSICINEKIETFNYLLSLKDKIPYNRGENVLEISISKSFHQVVESIFASSLIEDEDFMENARKYYSKEIDAQFVEYEKKQLEQHLSNPLKISKNIKL